MNTTIRGNSLKVAAMALIAVLIVLTVALAVQQVAPTGDRVDDPAVRATNGGGASFTQDPYIERHAEVVARYHEGSLR